MLTFITWTPLIYHFVFALLLLMALSLVTAVLRSPFSIVEFGIALVGCLALSFFGYFTHDLTIASLLIFIGGSFAVAFVSTHGELLTSFLASVLMIVMLYFSGVYLVEPYTQLTRNEIGTPARVMHQFLEEKGVLKKGSTPSTEQAINKGLR